MRIAYISTNMPRSCGLATFNANLKSAIELNLLSNPKDSFVVAINDSENLDQYKYGDDVRYIIRQQDQKDYIRAAKFINTSAVDACILQHEFGIYGGDSGTYILPLLFNINKPLITILHTVLKEPSYLQKLIIKEIARQSSKIVVMAQKAVDFLIDVYNIDADKIALIEHGVPDYQTGFVNPVKEMSFFKNKRALLTFGLLSKNKGIETVIRALPKIVAQHPDVVYIIIGSTHPHVKKLQGEEYRESLKILAKKLDVTKNIIFINNFIGEDELVNYLSAAEIYITPYLTEAQITSGTLSYAIGAGAAVVSTPYWHAQELLADNRGKLFDFGDDEQLAKIVNHLLSDDKALKTIRDKAFNYGLNLRYPKIGKLYTNLLRKLVTENNIVKVPKEFHIDTEILPNFTLEHVKRLTDDTGII